jgi:methionyl aminopeptidase
MISLKTDKDLVVLRKSGEILAKVMAVLKKAVKPGITTLEIDRLAEEMIRKENALPAFKGYKGFPATICASVNEEIVHGIPGERVIKNGDLLKIDIGVNYQGYFTDSAVTIPVGTVATELHSLIDVTRTALSEGIKQLKSENHLSDISHSIQSHVERNGFSIVRQFVGHGVGFNLHEEPEIPNFGRPGQGPLLKAGMVFAIEPMVNMGSWDCEIMDNGWTAVTKDRLPSAHFEHTVALTANGPEILTV